MDGESDAVNVVESGGLSFIGGSVLLIFQLGLTPLSSRRTTVCNKNTILVC